MDLNGPCDFISVSKGQGQRRSSEVTYSSRGTRQLPYKRQCLLNLTSINSHNCIMTNIIRVLKERKLGFKFLTETLVPKYIYDMY